MAISKEVKEYIKSVIDPLLTKESLLEIFEKFQNDIIAKFENVIKEKDAKITELESQIAVQQNSIDKLIISCDDNQQYARRSSLRIHGIPTPEDGVEEDINSTLTKCYQEMNLTFNEENIDRAHRIGKCYKDIASGKITQSIIVKFKDWKSRQELYKARPKYFVNGKKKPGRKFSITPDLTIRRYNLLKKAKGQIKDKSEFSYALIDTNCSLALKIKDGPYRYFNSDKELNDIIDEYLN